MMSVAEVERSRAMSKERIVGVKKYPTSHMIVFRKLVEAFNLARTVGHGTHATADHALGSFLNVKGNEFKSCGNYISTKRRKAAKEYRKSMSKLVDNVCPEFLHSLRLASNENHESESAVEFDESDSEGESDESETEVHSRKRPRPESEIDFETCLSQFSRKELGEILIDLWGESRASYTKEKYISEILKYTDNIVLQVMLVIDVNGVKEGLLITRCYLQVLTVARLKVVLERLDEPVTGNKRALIQRIIEYARAGEDSESGDEDSESGEEEPVQACKINVALFNIM